MKKKISIAAIYIMLIFALLISGCAQTKSEAEEAKITPQPVYEEVSRSAALEDTALEWHYLDNPGELALISDKSWNLPEYDDTVWKTGGRSFGSKNGEHQELSGGYMPDVLLQQYLEDGNNIPVYYFRTSISKELVTEKEFYPVSVTYDDSVIIYLNGTPVYYGNTPSNGFQDDNYGCKESTDAPVTDSFLLTASQFTKEENVLAVELHQANKESSDIYFDLAFLDQISGNKSEFLENSICLGIGEKEDEMLITWQGFGDRGYVEVAKKKENTDEFPEDEVIFQAKEVYDNTWESKTFRAVISGLSPGKEYVYRVMDNTISDIYSFVVPESGSFSFIVNGDPQISDADKQSPIHVYDELIERASENKTPAFILSLGDQSDEADNPDLYVRYLSTKFSTKLPIAPIVGNHERDSDTFSRFFYMPHMDGKTVQSSGDMSGDYWFGRGNTLFYCLNSNSKDVEKHSQFMKEALENYTSLYGEPKWSVAAFHHSVFSAGKHANDDNIVERRELFTPMLTSMGVDVVFMGHDHLYTRTYPMSGTNPLQETGNEIDNPAGIIYFTLGSSTGTKYYDPYDRKTGYAAVSSKEQYPSMTRVDVTDNSFMVSTYSMEDTGELTVLDTYQITKEDIE
ncbi:MAG: metallophosphoesterase [Lachnospiraceae bacterium]